MRFLAIAVALALALSAFAREERGPSARAAVRAMEARYQHARGLKAAFFESYNDGNGGVSAESGTAYFSHPGRMRWDYESPEKKLFLVDGKNVWFYIPADHTASRAKLSESSDWRTPLAILAGKANVAEFCRDIQSVDTGQTGAADAASARVVPAPNDTLLRCIPRQSASSAPLREVLFEVNPQSFLVRLVIREAGGVTTEFRFGNWEENNSIPESDFHFVPPAGVTVVDEEALAETIH
jgi:outer membrane lipoprotein carrier protein